MFRLGKPRLLPLALCAALLLSLPSCGDGEQHRQAEQAEPAVLLISPDLAETIRTLSPAPSLPTDPTNRYADDPGAAHFGQFLFFDTALSTRNDMSCATCHAPDKAFTDGLSVAEAMGTGTRNTPTVINAAHYPWLNWDGSADTLWAQAARPFESDHELGTTRTSIAKAIGTDPLRRRAYEQIFGELPPAAFFENLPPRAMPRPGDKAHPDQIAWSGLLEEDRIAINRIFVHVCKALGAYQRRLNATDSPFDRFAASVKGQAPNLWTGRATTGFSVRELQGLELFAGEADCIACHAGPFFSDFAFHSVRVAPSGGGAPTDPGRYGGLADLFASELNSAGAFSDDSTASRAARLSYLSNPSSNWGRFRTPSLRNVALTAPYMHAGQYPTLERVLDHYSTFADTLPPDHHSVQERLLRPLNLSEDQKLALIAFLRSLTDTSIEPGLLKAPGSPLPDAGEAKTGP